MIKRKDWLAKRWRHEDLRRLRHCVRNDIHRRCHALPAVRAEGYGRN